MTERGECVVVVDMRVRNPKQGKGWSEKDGCADVSRALLMRHLSSPGATRRRTESVPAHLDASRTIPNQMA